MRMMNKNVSVSNNISVSVSRDIKALLPDVLIEYLWKLVLCRDLQNREQQTFVLKTGELGGQRIQDIRHVCDNGNLIDTRRVYGVEPVNCSLQVYPSQEGYRMKLCAGF